MRRPNIVLITTDQQRADAMGCAGAEWMKTPHLDGIAAQGVRFDRAYSTSPLCTPSRVSLFTGMYPSNHGAWNVGCNAADEGGFISNALRESGYATCHLGKAHWQANMASPEQSVESLHGRDRFPDWKGPYYGFQHVELSIGHAGYDLEAGHYAEWVRQQSGGQNRFSWHARSTRPFGGEAVDWGLPVRWRQSVWLADRAVSFLGSRKESEPFFLHLGFEDPHHPHALPMDLTEKIDPASVAMPVYRDGELDLYPDHYRAAREGRLENHGLRGAFPMAGQGQGFDYRGLAERDVREARAYYYTACQLIDQQVGRVLAQLEAMGLRDNTLIIFTSDHGEMLGDHGLWLKGCFPFDEVLRVPLLMSWPSRLRGGRTVSSPFSLVDVAPTLLSAAGLGFQGRDGVNWLPCLEDVGTPSPRDMVFAEHIDDPNGVSFRTAITSDYKLTKWQDGDFTATTWDDQPASVDVTGVLNGAMDKALPARPRRLPRHAYS